MVNLDLPHPKLTKPAGLADVNPDRLAYSAYSTIPEIIRIGDKLASQKLCNVPEPVRKILEMSRLTAVFDTHESEEKAVTAFYEPGVRAERPVPIGSSEYSLIFDYIKLTPQ